MCGALDPTGAICGPYGEGVGARICGDHWRLKPGENKKVEGPGSARGAIRGLGRYLSKLSTKHVATREGSGRQATFCSTMRATRFKFPCKGVFLLTVCRTSGQRDS